MRTPIDLARQSSILLLFHGNQSRRSVPRPGPPTRRPAPPPSLESLEGDHSASWQFKHRSTTAVIGHNILWLHLVQAIRYLFTGTFLTPAFLITLPMDVALTVTSHWIAIGPRFLDPIRSFLSGKALGPNLEQIARIVANTVFGTLNIVIFWSVYEWLHPSRSVLTARNVLSALGLCLVVYILLQISKTSLFHTMPLNADRRRCHEALALFPELSTLESAASASARASGIAPQQVSALMLTWLDRLIFRLPFEERIAGSSLGDRDDIHKALRRIASASSAEGLAEARRTLVGRLLRLHDSEGSDPLLSSTVAGVLTLDHPFSAARSIELLNFLHDRRASHRRYVRVAAFFDQLLATGLAGGVGLYSLNASVLGM